MPFHLPRAKEPRQLASVGTHTGICTCIADLGTQTGPFGTKRQLHIGWELTDPPMSNGRAFEVSKRYNFTNHQNGSLRGDLEDWLGQDIAELDLSTLIGRTATLSIVHVSRGDRTFANVDRVMPSAKGGPLHLTCSVGGVAFNLDDSPFDQAAYDKLPTWLRTAIAASPEYIAAVNPPKDSAASVTTQPPLREALDDAIPF